jgi:hypothetical protein
MAHPAGGKWHWEPNPDYVAHLDDIFVQGNAPHLAGMLLSLAEPSTTTGIATPCYLDIPAMAPFTPNDGEFTSYEVTGSEQLGTDAYSILRGSVRKTPRPDLTVEEFFYHADILSGQDVGRVRPHLGTKLDRLDLIDCGFVERAATALDATRAGDATSIWDDVSRVFLEETAGEGSIWHAWTGAAATDAKERFTRLKKWFCQEASDGVFRQAALRQLVAILVRYAATIHGARMNLDNLMGELVDEVTAWNEKTDLGAAPGKWVALTSIADLVSKTPIGVAVNVLQKVAESADELTAEKQLTESYVYDKLAAFLDAAKGIVVTTCGQVDALVTELQGVRADRHSRKVDIPVWDS